VFDESVHDANRSHEIEPSADDVVLRAAERAQPIPDLESRGAEIGKVFRITPDKKELSVAMLRCSRSELLELIEIAR